ncbi:NAD(P)/FAD-dependent oxidoreductase [Terracidiphilus sp.]|uniref:NAD(P)/FAD-dependent oxidoreductase n=1 Tax=Terracidiphilus sp. TaxID=1964191 RepID=UPI003C13A21F
MREFDVIVLGAGAAGLVCASVAGQRGRRVALLEHNTQPGRKILISGGGRCNFTNIHTAPDRYLSANPHFVKSALALYLPAHFLELVERYGIAWHEKTLGQLFCDHSSRQILDMLLTECNRGKVELILNARSIAVERDSTGFCIASSLGEFHSGALIVATGGLSIPKLGATSFAYDLARQFGLRIVTPRPALVPLLLSGEEANWTALSGVSTEVIAWTEAPSNKPNRQPPPRFREKMLVTHRGLSGPAILQASSYWQPGEPVYIDLAPQLAKDGCLLAPLLEKNARRDPQTFRQALRNALPLRLANHLAEAAAPAGWTNVAIETTERELRRYAFHPTGTEGYEKAEVTAGGIDTRDLHARTMESRTTPGLYFIGEAVDVTGHLGGFNFQWAWASAVAAANAV